MAKEPDNLVLEYLRAIRAVLDQHSQEFADIKLRLSGIEQHIAGYGELDRLNERVSRIGKRLELADGK
jgi:hypothetical protein